MIALNENFVVDGKGTRVGVLLDLDDDQRLLKDLEELEAIRAYDAAKESGDEAVPFDQAIQVVESAKQ